MNYTYIIMAQKQLHVCDWLWETQPYGLKYNFKIQEKLGSYGLHWLHLCLTFQ